MNSYEIIEEAVRKFWKENYPQNVIAFFYQKYDYEDSWEWCEELVECCGYNDYEHMEFFYDFCEGQTCVKDLIIVPLSDVAGLYTNNKILKRGLPDEKIGRWIETDDYDAWAWRCSKCDEYFCFDEGTPQDNKYYYCPCCGAKMRMEND